MAEQDILQNLISRLGQSQAGRAPAALDPAHAPVDGRSAAELLEQARRLAAHLRFHRHDPAIASGTWAAFFPPGDDEALLARDDGGVPPHLALYAAFLELYALPRAEIDRLTAAHLDFQYRQALGFSERAAVPDRAHLLLELKKGVAPLAIDGNATFTAGKDASGVERLYRPVREVVLGPTAVSDLKSVHRSGGHLYFAPIANSADGLGGDLDAANPMWMPFGHTGLPPAQPGCAFSSPVLRMAEGQRSLTLEVDLANLLAERHTGANLAEAFDAYLTGPKGWLGPYLPSGRLSGARLSLSVTLSDQEPAVVDYDAAVHGQAYAALAPVLHLQLRKDAQLRYADLEHLTVGKARLSVHVDGMQTLALENDQGNLNPKRAFQPFGAQPATGSRFLVGCPEALSKRLTDLRIRLAWQAAPSDLHAWYLNYKNRARLKDGVSAQIVYQDRSGQAKTSTFDLMARVNGVTTLAPGAPPAAAAPASPYAGIYSLFHGGSARSRLLAERHMLARPLFLRSRPPAPEARSGFVTVQLAEDFLHADYRRESVEHAVLQDKTVLNEPYTPTVQSIRLTYAAQSDEVDIADPGEASFDNLDLRFFHVGCFGQMREHAFLRAGHAHLTDKRVSLLPAYPDEGELLIGLTGAAAGDGVSLLVQVAEGSADPELAPRTLQWSVLCDNTWRPLSAEEMPLDTSSHLRRSGIIALTLPSPTTTDNTLLPAGRVWLRAAAQRDSRAACQLLSVAANAVEVAFADQGNDPAHLASALPAGSIAKLKDPPAGLKAIRQPYASFAGRLPETPASLRRRAAERLRHRQRAITVWDYERLVLEAFPEIHKVKCVPHAKPGSWLAPGHLLLVVVPDLRNRNSLDPLRPRADIDTLARIAELVRGHCGMQVGVTVKNPFFQRVRLAFKVRMRPGYAYNHYSGRLQEALRQALSPWAYDAARPIEFGGRVYRSVLLDVVEELPYVDFVTDFRMHTFDAAGVTSPDLTEVAAATPDAILVSDASHDVAELTAA